jgi:glucokinase
MASHERSCGVSNQWLGLDIGGTKLAAAVVDDSGIVLSEVRAATDTAQGADHVLESLIQLGRAALADAAVDAVRGVGIGCGGPLDPIEGVIYGPPNLPGWVEVPVRRVVEEAFALPTVLANDGDVAALGEHRFGQHPSEHGLVYMTISTGCGGGAVLDDRLLQGATGSATEFGHIVVDPHGRPCLCGMTGCLEAYVSGTSIARAATEAIQSGAPTILSQLDKPTAEDVVRAASANDAVATRVWMEALEALAAGLATITNILDPDVIVLGGGVTRSGSALFDPLESLFRGRQFRRTGLPPTPIRPSSLGDHVGVIGAAALAQKEFSK